MQWAPMRQSSLVTASIHNGKVVRSSAGSLFHLPVVRDRDTVSVIEQIRAAGIQILATAADGEVDLDEADELLRKPTAWLFGNEAHGLDPAIAAQADHRVRIPIHGRAESLNLATAAAIACTQAHECKIAPPITAENAREDLTESHLRKPETIQEQRQCSVSSNARSQYEVTRSTRSKQYEK
ncbi:hypothetical protein GCM10020255_084510 [Rhodococcus baikonurensis]